MKHGDNVSRFESELAAYCGATFCVSASNGTVTLSAALVALGVKPGDRVATTPLTMAATTIAILNVGAVPVYCDVDPDTWLMAQFPPDVAAWMPVQLYGLSQPCSGARTVVDAAQTLGSHRTPVPLAPGLTPELWRAFTSLSFQRSKILSTGEGGALLTNDEGLAERARSYLSLGYRMGATQARVDSNAIKSPTYERHHMYPAINGRMNDVTAAEGLRQLEKQYWAREIGDVFGGDCEADMEIENRRLAASYYRRATAGCNWLTPQHVPEGWEHDYWTFAVACDTPARANTLAQSVVNHGGERPYGAWLLTYQEPAFAHLLPDCRQTNTEGLCWQCQPGPCKHRQPRAICPVAESLQPRLLQFQCNNLQSAETNARALRKAIEELS